MMLQHRRLNWELAQEAAEEGQRNLIALEAAVAAVLPRHFAEAVVVERLVQDPGSSERPWEHNSFVQLQLHIVVSR